MNYTGKNSKETRILWIRAMLMALQTHYATLTDKEGPYAKICAEGIALTICDLARLYDGK